MKKQAINNHGNVILYPVKSIKPPKTAKKSKVHVLEESTTTRNRHEVATKKGYIYRFTKGGVEYLHCNYDYEIRHVGGDGEHGTQKVKAGTREVRHEQEWNPWKHELRRIVD